MFTEPYSGHNVRMFTELYSGRKVKMFMEFPVLKDVSVMSKCFRPLPQCFNDV